MIYFVSQLLAGEKFLTLAELQNKFKYLRIDYLFFHSLTVLLSKTKQSLEKQTEMLSNDTQSSWAIIFKTPKGASLINKTLIKKNYTPKGISKWQEKEFFEDFNWKDLFINLNRTTKDTKLVWFQYIILHNILTTNRTISKYNLEHSELCSFCLKEPECQIVQSFWKSTENVINLKCKLGVSFSFTKKEIILGFSNSNNSQNNRILNLILLTCKYHIYKCKVNNT